MRPPKVVSVRWPTGTGTCFGGIYFETDELGARGGRVGSDLLRMVDIYDIAATWAWHGDPCDMPEDTQAWTRIVVDLTPHFNEIIAAINKVCEKNLSVEKVTIIKGVVQAHPEAKDHYRCPFCYPEEGE
jgi:hypothetical protein